MTAFEELVEAGARAEHAYDHVDSGRTWESDDEETRRYFREMFAQGLRAALLLVVPEPCTTCGGSGLIDAGDGITHSAACWACDDKPSFSRPVFPALVELGAGEAVVIEAQEGGETLFRPVEGV